MEKHVAVAGKNHKKDRKVENPNSPFNKFEPETKCRDECNSDNREYCLSLFFFQSEFIFISLLCRKRNIKKNVINNNQAKEKGNNANVINRRNNGNFVIIFVNKLYRYILPENIDAMIEKCAFVEQEIKPECEDKTEKDKFFFFFF